MYSGYLSASFLSFISVLDYTPKIVPAWLAIILAIHVACTVAVAGIVRQELLGKKARSLL